jgi:hypothetical protein
MATTVGDVTGAGLASAAAQQGRSVTDLMFSARMKLLAQSILRNSTPLEDCLDDDFFADAR